MKPHCIQLWNWTLKNSEMESFYIDPHVHEENAILNRSGYDPYNTSQLFPYRDGPNRYESMDFIPAVVQTSTDPLFHSLTEQGTLRRVRRYDLPLSEPKSVGALVLGMS